MILVSGVEYDHFEKILKHLEEEKTNLPLVLLLTVAGFVSILAKRRLVSS